MPPCRCPRYHVSAPRWAKTAKVACADCGIVHGYVSIDTLYDVPGLAVDFESGYPYLDVTVAADSLPALQASEPVCGEPRP